MHALAGLVQQTREIMPDHWWHRYREQLAAWIRAAAEKLLTYVQPGRTPTLRQYLAIRPADGGMLLAAMWCEIAEQCVTPDWNTPLVQGLLHSFSACGYLANDLAAGPDETFTAVAALVRTADLSPRDARQRAQSLLSAEEQRFWWAHTALRDSDESRPHHRTGLLRATTRFALHLDRFRLALHEWTGASSRYASAGDQSPGPT
ncbi:hypothetical protein P3T37_005708 [Kitasatospora sp. MAA4]|nr:hypothetical protein [Kitasatospora sp. MAA4]